MNIKKFSDLHSDFAGAGLDSHKATTYWFLLIQVAAAAAESSGGIILKDLRRECKNIVRNLRIN